MQRLKEFINSIYLGDRYCERVEINTDKIIIQINLISRIEEGSREWNYYSQEDIEHGCLVFDNVAEYSQSSELPFNDEIYKIQVTGKENDIYSFIVYGCSVSDEAFSTDIQLHIRAKKFYILDPKNHRIVTNTTRRQNRQGACNSD